MPPSATFKLLTERLAVVPAGMLWPLVVAPLLVTFNVPAVATVTAMWPPAPSRISPLTVEKPPTASVSLPPPKLMLPRMLEGRAELPVVVTVSPDEPSRILPAITPLLAKLMLPVAARRSNAVAMLLLLSSGVATPFTLAVDWMLIVPELLTFKSVPD